MTKGIHILAIDPAKSSGWARVDDGVVVDSGQGLAADVRKEILTGKVPDVVCLELGFEGRNSWYESRNRAQKENHDIRIGYYYGLASVISPDFTLWKPRPSEWRAVLRRAGFKIPDSPRHACKEASLRIAREKLGVPCTGPKGGKQEDRADAVCIGYAAWLRMTREGWKIAGGR